MATPKELLPQEGTSLIEAGESLTGSRRSGSVCPSYSGGGKKRQERSFSRQDGSEEETMERGRGHWEERDSDDLESEVDLPPIIWTSTPGEEGGDRKRRRGISAASPVSDVSVEARSPVLGPRRAYEGSRQVALRRQARAEKRLDVDRRLEDLAREASRSRSSLGYVPDVEDARTAAALHQRVVDDVAIITEVATKSMNLKGTVVRALKEAAASIKAAAGALHDRTVSQETAVLQEDNCRLQLELVDLRREMTGLRAEFRREMERVRKEAVPQSPAPGRPEATAEPLASQEEWGERLTRSIMLQVGGMVSARLDGLEERLLPEKRLRPPLAADRRNAASAAAATASPPEAVERAPAGGGPSTSGASAPEATAPKPKKGKGKGKKTAAASAVASTPTPSTKVAPRPLPPAPVSMDAEWSTVAKRGKKKKRQQEAAPAPAPAGAAATKPGVKKAPVKLRPPPRSAAVVLTLQPGAEERGASYVKVLQECRAKIDLASCGITAGLRFKKAVTGGCILEVPGAASGDKADAFAQRIREVVDPETVRVSRPTRCADLRVSGLDDSVSVPEVVAAVARRGACPEGSVKAGELRTDSRGFSTVWVSCPVAAAKKVGEGGRLLVGWTSAQVTLLKPRPLRCYRCLHIGHVRARCTAEEDRSTDCYRCGTPGHKAAGCTAAAPRCSLCAAAGKKADHRVGSGACSPPPPRQMRTARVWVPSHPPNRGEDGMDASPS